MSTPAYQNQPVSEGVPAGTVGQAKVSYIAACETCPYFGPERGSSVVALRDYDRHAATTAHAIAVVMATAKEDDDDDD